MNPIYRFVIFLLLSASIALTGVQAQGLLTDYDTKKMMEDAKQQMLNGDYERANKTFREILKSGKVLPTNLSYLFAETLYQIGQFQNSQNFLNKYLKLTGKGGDYYEESNYLQSLLDAKFSHIQSCQFCDIRGYRLIPCDRCIGHGKVTSECYYCKGIGKTACQLCDGQGVVITANVFGARNYISCQKCSAEGIHSCPVCEGNKQIESACPVCLGATFKSSNTVCDHEDHSHHHPAVHTNTEQ